MRKGTITATFVVCPMCDEKKCVGRHNCKQIEGYLKRKDEEWKEKERKVKSQ